MSKLKYARVAQSLDNLKSLLIHSGYLEEHMSDIEITDIKTTVGEDNVVKGSLKVLLKGKAEEYYKKKEAIHFFIPVNHIPQKAKDKTIEKEMNYEIDHTAWERQLTSEFRREELIGSDDNVKIKEDGFYLFYDNNEASLQRVGDLDIFQGENKLKLIGYSNNEEWSRPTDTISVLNPFALNDTPLPAIGIKINNEQLFLSSYLMFDPANGDPYQHTLRSAAYTNKAWEKEAKEEIKRLTLSGTFQYTKGEPEPKEEFITEGANIIGDITPLNWSVKEGEDYLDAKNIWRGVGFFYYARMPLPYLYRITDHDKSFGEGYEVTTVTDTNELLHLDVVVKDGRGDMSVDDLLKSINQKHGIYHGQLYGMSVNTDGVKDYAKVNEDVENKETTITCSNLDLKNHGFENEHSGEIKVVYHFAHKAEEVVLPGEELNGFDPD